jgi:hypothetical protein
MILTERDCLIFQSLYDYRYLSASQLLKLHFASQQTLNRRIRILSGGGYLYDFKLAGTNERLIGLTKTGASVVAERLGSPLEELSWSAQRPQDYYFLKHFLMINDLRISLVDSCRRHGVKLIGFLPEYYGKETSKGRQKYIRDSVRDCGEPLTHTPDGAFVIQKNGTPALFFLEADRGTEVLSNPRRGYLKMLRFYLNYLLANTYQRYARHFDVELNLFRVLIVTTTHHRATNMLNNGCAYPFQPDRSKGFIWLTHSLEDFLTTEWKSLGGGTYTIL